MTGLSTKAREAALSCEAKKHAYRQTQDGVVVSFVLHPQEVPEGLAIASLGTRYLLALVELNDDETPKEVMPNQRPEEPIIRSPEPSDKTPPASADKPARAHRSWHEMTPAQQAGVLCADKAFQTFMACSSEDDAAKKVRWLCRVTSRSHIPTDSEPWRKIVSEYRAWVREPEYVG